MSFINYFAEAAEEAEERLKKAEEERKKVVEKVKELRLKRKNGEITWDEFHLEMDKIGL